MWSIFTRKSCANCSGCERYKGVAKLMPDKKVVHEGKKDVCTVGGFELKDLNKCELWKKISKTTEIDGASPEK